MSQMNHHYEPEFKERLVRLHLEDGRSLKSLAAEYGVAHGSVTTAQLSISTTEVL